MKRLALPLAAALALLSSPVLAQSNWYAGLSAGQSITSKDLVTNRETTLTLATDLATEFDDKDKAWKALVGYRFGPMIAIELNYVDLGSHRTHTTLMGGDPPQPAATTIHREITGFGADLVLSAPLAQNFEIFGRVGAVRTQLKARADLFGNIVFTNGDPSERSRSTDHDETVGRYGLGAQWSFGSHTALRLEWERYAEVGKAFEVGGTGTTGEADTDFVSLGVVVRF